MSNVVSLVVTCVTSILCAVFTALWTRRTRTPSPAQDEEDFFMPETMSDSLLLAEFFKTASAVQSQAQKLKTLTDQGKLPEKQLLRNALNSTFKALRATQGLIQNVTMNSPDQGPTTSFGSGSAST